MPPVVAHPERPRVPNHELVRVIGRGAYGEIWMARSLTGALRAIKIVDQRTFENESSFQREFEGMARFEPISRSDAGFVDILHVGRDDGGHFFYYVMELADDVTGEHVDPDLYVPKTLRTELRRRSRLLVTECLDIALSLTRALGVLHQRGLVHRDIKPANIIFVGGVPKIADIGLVAASGQSSFVGTEGYVPPEGPGTVQADLYSLGKVLYEMAMGKDRLDFPALHSDLTSLPDKERLMRVNALLLRACAPDPRSRYLSADEMHADLERIRMGRTVAPRHRRAVPLLGLTAALALTGGAGVWWSWQREPGSVSVETDPPGAMVLLKDGGPMRHSPARFDHVTGGQHTIRVMLPGYDALELPVQVAPHRASSIPTVHLARSHGRLEIASTPDGADYAVLQNEKTLATGKCPMTIDDLETGEYEVRFALAGSSESRKVEVVRGEPATVSAEFVFSHARVSSQPPGAEISVDGQPAGKCPLDLTLARGSHALVARYGAWPEQRQTIDTASTRESEVAFAFDPGSVKISSSPTGAVVYRGKEELGKAPLLLEKLEPGPVTYELRLAGYKPCTLAGEVKPGEQLFLGGRLLQRAGPRRGEPWENSLGMKFLPVGNVLFAVTPARVKDYEAFAQATSRYRPLPDFQQEQTHPVVRVNWDDATSFCDWLTQKEGHGGLLEPGQIYRLPTDAEWSEAAGLPPESGATPEQRDGKLPDFPWGRQFPPPAGSGNYADSSLKGATRISGYRDGYAQTSPVGSFAANRFGLFDMSGNVWQWVQDSYKGEGGRGKDWGVLRGGSWATAAPAELRSSYRNVIDRTERDVIFGFRVVLVPEP